MKARERVRTPAAELLATEFPRSAGARQAVAERPAGAVSGAVPRRRPGSGARCARYADEVKAIMRANPNLRGVNDNWNESVKALRLDIDQDKARALGVTSQVDRAGGAHRSTAATTIGQYRDGDKLIDIVLRQPLERAQRDRRPGQRLRAHRQRQEHAARRRSRRARFAWEPGVLWREAATTPPRCRATSSRACRARP